MLIDNDIPMGTGCVVDIANFYHLPYESDFLNHLLKNKTCHVCAS